jgi:hypothetical protein
MIRPFTNICIVFCSRRGSPQEDGLKRTPPANQPKNRKDTFIFFRGPKIALASTCTQTWLQSTMPVPCLHNISHVIRATKLAGIQISGTCRHVYQSGQAPRFLF